MALTKFTKIISIGGNRCAVQEDGKTLPTPRRVAYWYGDSSRTKPKLADGARDGDELYEDDTKKGYVFNANIDDWRPVSG